MHRDIKPSNILFDGTNEPKVADVGIAHDATQKLTATGARVGTPEYMCPERIAAHPVTPASDLYSAGVVLYELITGSPPFSHESDYVLMHKHLTEAPDLERFPSGTTPHLRRVVALALAKEPNQRWPSARAMIDALKGADAGQPRLPPPFSLGQ